jgi:L-threonylcarbamoyladenylate synthase
MPPDELAAKLAKPSNERLAVLAPLTLLENCLADIALAIAAGSDPDDYARLLYSALHRLDASGADRMLVAAPPDGPQWEAVRDRLRRAEAAKPG